MNIECRKFTNANWRFKHSLLFRTFSLASLLVITLPNFIAFEGLAKQTTRQVGEEKPRIELNSSNRLDAGDLTAAEAARGSVGSLDALNAVNYQRIDIDLTRQRLSVIDSSGRVTKVLPISSGSGKWYVSQGERRRAVTPTGRFRVYRKIPGWRRSPLGLMYYPVYIVGGIAIHGSPSVPPRPASHGCIRIPMSAAVAFYNSAPIGTVVHVHY